MALEPGSWAWKIPRVAFYDSYEEISAFFFFTRVIDLFPPNSVPGSFLTGSCGEKANPKPSESERLKLKF